MKITFAVCGAAALFFAAVFSSRAGIIAGPITNPANGHDYYLLAPATWSVSEAEAGNLDGTLAIVRNAAEEQWIYQTFGNYAGTNHSLWIGLHRMWSGGPFAWMDGTKPGYVNWDDAQPDNANNTEQCVEIYSPISGKGAGRWNDATDNRKEDDSPLCGVVEVPGKANETSLTAQEKSLIGVWFALGEASHPCYVTATENMLFAINHGRAGRLWCAGKGDLFLTSWNAHGEINRDLILWSNGSWWSRKPSDYTDRQPANGDIDGWPTPMPVGPRPAVASGYGL